jgi:serine/threonine-protein kinase
MELADQLNPTLPNPLPYIARHLTLHRQFDALDAVLREMERRHGKDHMYSCAVRTRMAGWRGDAEALRRFCADKSEQFEKPHWRPLTLYVRGLLGEIGEDEIARGFARLLTDTQSPRFITFLMQFQTELHAGRGEVSTAMLHLLRAATSMLIDLEWLDRCPLLESLRSHPDFGEARRRVRARAEAIWAT